MSSITIHDLEKDLELSIRQKAKKEQVSLNKTIKKLLRQALGLEDRQTNHLNDFTDVFGKWDKKDLKEFKKAISDFNKINPEEWA